MKKVFVFIALTLGMNFAKAQQITPCDELFISEYVEGSRNNKALEIYNPSDRTIDMKEYRITRWQNGSATWAAQYSDALSGTIGPKETRVLVLDKRDTTLSGTDTPVVETLRLKADLFLSPVYEVSYSMYFNGDDAMSIDRFYADFNTWVPVDIMGKIGERPPFGGWSDSFPYNNGLGKWYTANHTLIRKRNVLTGVDTIAPIKRGVTQTAPQAANPTYFNPSVEWELYPIDFFDSLGSHDCECLTLNRETQDLNVAVFPNPIGEEFFVSTAVNITQINVMDLKGMQVPVNVTMGLSGKQAKIQSELLGQGIWILNVQMEDGKVYTTKIQK